MILTYSCHHSCSMGVAPCTTESTLPRTNVSQQNTWPWRPKDRRNEGSVFERRNSRLSPLINVNYPLLYEAKASARSSQLTAQRGPARLQKKTWAVMSTGLSDTLFVSSAALVMFPRSHSTPIRSTRLEYKYHLF